VTKGLPSRSPPIQLPILKKGGSCQSLPGKAPASKSCKVNVQARQFGEEGVVVVADAVADFVDHRQPGRAQHARAPQPEHGAAQREVVLLRLIGRELQAVTLVEQAGDFVLALQDALTRHLGRMRREHRRDQGRREKCVQFVGCDPGLLKPVQCPLQAAVARRRVRSRVRPAATEVVLVFGNVRQMQEVAEGTDDGSHRVARQVLEDGFQFGARGRAKFAIRVLVQLDGALANALDRGKYVVPFLFPYGIAKQSAEQSGVVSQREVLVLLGRHGRGSSGGWKAVCTVKAATSEVGSPA
jgi:hypothetical protein